MRHPLTNVCIAVDAEGNPSFTDQDVNRIPLAVVEHDGAGQWIPVVEHELIQLFEWETGPFMRVVWCRSHECSELVLVYHHMVADGLSGAYLLRDLLAYIDDPDAEVEPLPALPPMTELLPAEVKSTAHAKAIVEGMIAAAGQSQGQSMTVANFLSLPPPSLRVLTWEMDAPASGKALFPLPS